MTSRRYHNFALKTIQAGKPSQYGVTDMKHLTKKFGPYFEISERINKVHSSVFQSPAVSFLKINKFMTVQ